MKRLDYYWSSKNLIAVSLLPLAWLFAALSLLRRIAFRFGVLTIERLPVPVIVVGNITVGGTGKTPFAIWLVHELRNAGYKPGVVSRGYGGTSATWPQWVDANSEPALVGDEPVLIARNAACPVAVAPKRAVAARLLIARGGCDVIICDDGLQHYALAHDIEIALVDGLRRFGNGWRLPAGPLREGVQRLESVDFVVYHGEAAAPEEFAMELRLADVVNLSDPSQSRTVASFAGVTVHAVAGIGNPTRFFRQLRTEGLSVTEHAFADHHAFSANDLQFNDDAPVLMTEKDAVKCRGFDDARLWVVRAQAHVDERLAPLVVARLKKFHGERSDG